MLRLGVYVFLALAGLLVSGWVLYPWAGALYAGVLSVLFAALLANGIALANFERGGLGDVGLPWNRAAWVNALVGILSGAVAALLVLGGPVLFGAARFEPDPAHPALLRNFVFLSGALVLGAFGEELLFRGYGFQTLWRAFGPLAALVVTGLLFGLAHASNRNATAVSVMNTALWGMLLGCAVVRSRDLWLATGVHLGWNWVFPFFGVRLSGFTMGVSGYALRWNAGDLWSGGAYGPEAGLLTLLVLPLLLLYLWKAPIRQQSVQATGHEDSLSDSPLSFRAARPDREADS